MAKPNRPLSLFEAQPLHQALEPIKFPGDFPPFLLSACSGCPACGHVCVCVCVCVCVGL